MDIPYILKRSRRKTLTLQIDQDGQLIVRAPIRAPVGYIESCIFDKRHWIKKHQEKIRLEQPRKIYSENEKIEMKKTLKIYLIGRVELLWKGKNLPPYTSIKVTHSEKRWGSCSGKNGLCFSYRLAEYLSHESSSLEQDEKKGGQFIDAIILHELAHLREKHHQKSFWKLLESWMPDYKEIIGKRRDFLKD